MSAMFADIAAADARTWQLKPLAEVAEILDGKRIPVNAKEREKRPGRVPYYGATGQVGWIDDFLFEEELVLLGEDGAPFLEPDKPKAYVVRGKSWVNNHAHVLRARGVPTGWLANYLNLVRYDGLVTGTTRMKLTQAAMRQIRVPVAPWHVMEERASKIDMQFSRLAEAIANLKRIKTNIKRYRAAVLSAAVEGRLVETEAALARRERRGFLSGVELLRQIINEREHTRSSKGSRRQSTAPSSSDSPTLPDGWVWCSISQVCDVASGNTPAGVLEAVRSSGELPWFKVGDMNHAENQKLMLRANTWLSREQARSLGLRVFPPNTIVFPKRGGAISTNKKRILNGPACADLNVMGITPAPEIESFFRLWFEGKDLGKLSDGSNVPQINHKDIDPLLMPLPPLAEQQRIVAEAERLLSIESSAEDQVAACTRRCTILRRAILGAAFQDGNSCV